MNKTELVDALAKLTGNTKVSTNEFVDAFVEVVTKELKKGGDVRLVGFGTFGVSKRKASEGRNPQTGAKIKIPAYKLPKFRAGKTLKDVVNKR